MGSIIGVRPWMVRIKCGLRCMIDGKERYRGAGTELREGRIFRKLFVKVNGERFVGRGWEGC